MSWGGKRKGAGRPTDKPNRQKFQYKLDPEVAEQFRTYCYFLRVPLSTTLESLMEKWILDHLDDLEAYNKEMEGLSGKEFLRWYKKHPTKPDNVALLETAKFRRDFLANSHRDKSKELEWEIAATRRQAEREAKQEHEQKMRRFPGVVASGFKLLLTNKGMQPEQITAADILDISGGAEFYTVQEVEEALSKLRDAGHLERIVQEVVAATEKARKPDFDQSPTS